MQPEITASDGGMSRLLQEEVRLGETRFFFRKLPFDKSVAVFEDIRYELRNAPDALSPLLSGGGGDDQEVSGVGVAIIKLILGLSPEFVGRVRRQMFESVRFATDNNPQPRPLRGDEEMAFVGLGVFEMYEVLARALAVNFFTLFRAWQSRWNGEDGQPTL